MKCNHRLHSQRWWRRCLSMKDTHSLRELCEEFGVTPGQLNANLKCYTDNPPPSKPKRRGRSSIKTPTDTNTNS